MKLVSSTRCPGPGLLLTPSTEVALYTARSEPASKLHVQISPKLPCPLPCLLLSSTGIGFCALRHAGVPVSRVLLAVSGRCRAASPSPPCCAWPSGMGKQRIFPAANSASFPAQTTPTGAHSFLGLVPALTLSHAPYCSQVCCALLRRYCALH